jgi:hypothetical protein
VCGAMHLWSRLQSWAVFDENSREEKLKSLGARARLQSRAIAPPRFFMSQILAPPEYIMQQFSMHYPPIDMGNILV